MKQKSIMAAAAFCAAFAMPPGAASADNKGKIYRITFAGRGDTTLVSNVTVENLSNGKSVSLGGKDTLVLVHPSEFSAVGVDNATAGDAGDMKIDGGLLTVKTAVPSNVNVAIYTVSGELVHKDVVATTFQSAALALPALGKGIYIVKATAPGLNKSVKWLCNGSSNLPALNLGGEDGDAGAKMTRVQTLPAIATYASPFKAEYLEYTEGDILRFTGETGKMRTIMMNTPHSSHPVYFDFFKCEDADGYNYTIVRVGDMMWMAEDLRATNVSGVSKVSKVEDWGGSDDSQDAKLYSPSTGNVYYSKAAALKALPEGWSLPTLGEIDYLVKKTTDYYGSAGKAFKSRGNEWGNRVSDVDEYSVGITPAGYIKNGAIQDAGNAVLLTRSTKGLKPTSFEISDNSDELTMTNGYDIHNLGFHVRGVRSAPSAYTPMLRKFGMVPQTKATKTSDESDYGPLGKLYTMLDGRQSLAFDYSGGQLNSANAEKRSGILTLRNPKNTGLMEEDFDNNGFIGQENASTLRKMAAMTVNGRQYIIEAKWRCPFQLWTRVDENGNIIRTDNHDEIGLTYYWADASSRVVDIEIYGDSAMGHKLIKTFTVTGLNYDDNQFTETFPYFLYNGRTTETRYDFATRYFQLLTADFTRDGTDEIVVCFFGYMTILDGNKVLNGTKNSCQWNEWNNARNSAVYAFDSFNRWDRGYDSYTVARLAVGDVNGNGTPDLVMLRARNNQYIKKLDLVAVDFTQGPYYGNWEGEMCLSYDHVMGNAMYLQLGDIPGDRVGKTWFLDVKVGNVTNGKYPDIVTLHREYSDKSYAQSATLGVYQYTPDGSYGLDGPEFKAIPVEGGTVSGGFRSNAGCAGNCNVTLLCTEHGISSNRDIIVGADLWRWDANAGKVKFDRQVLDWMDTGNYSIFADNIIPVNITGDSQPEAVYYFASMSTSDSAGKRYLYSFLGANYLTWYSTGGTEDHLLNWKEWEYNTQKFKYNTQGNQWSSNKECELMWWFGTNNGEWGNNPAMCAVNINARCKTLEYKSTQKAFSEPTIYAMIAAPPTYLYGEYEKAPSEDYVTTWGYSRSHGTETTSSGSISASIIGGFEYEFSVPLVGQKVGGVDFTAKLQSEFSKSTTAGSSVTYSQTYEARDDDRVVMQVTPYTLYTYEITNAADPDEIGGDYYVAIPGKPKTIGLGLADYEALVGDAPGAPYLGNVFKHTIGDPFSYPSKPGEINGWGVMWGNGDENSYVTTGSGGATTREISIEKSSSTSTGFSFSTETELVVTAGCLKAGVGFGYNRSNEISHTETEGFAVSASVPGLVVGDTNPDRTFFDWNLCWYNHSAGGQNFPVVNYVVRPMSFDSNKRKF